MSAAQSCDSFLNSCHRSQYFVIRRTGFMRLHALAVGLYESGPQSPITMTITVTRTISISRATTAKTVFGRCLGHCFT